MLKIIPTLLLLAGLPAIASAQYAPAEAPRDVHVTYHDLDLHSAAGIAVLDRRLSRAVSRVCPDDASTDVASRLAAARCRTAKRADIMAQREVALARASHAGTAVASTR